MSHIVTTSILIMTIGFISIATITAQDQQTIREVAEDFYVETSKEVLLDPSIRVNARHPYIKQFTEKDNDFITWLYVNNLINIKYGQQQYSTSDEDRNQSLVFTLLENGQTTYDTVRNSVHIANGDKYDEKSWDIFGIRKVIAKRAGKRAYNKLNLRGDLPKGCMSYIDANKRKLACGVQIPKDGMHVVVKVTDRKGNLIETLKNETLTEGWHKFKWNQKKTKRGKFSLAISIDGSEMIQDFKL